MKKFMRAMKLTAIVAAVLFIAGTVTPILALAADKPAPGKALPGGTPTYKVAISIYVGWMPWYYAMISGIMNKWADHYGIKVILDHKSYGGSMAMFANPDYDGVVITNMDALASPCAGGIDCTVAIVGDYSNDNDQVLVWNTPEKPFVLKKGMHVLLVQNSVSQHLFAQYLMKTTGGKLKESDFVLENGNDENIGPTFLADKGNTYDILVTWNPIVMQVRQASKDITSVFGSSQIPGEIMDLLVLKTATVNRDPRLAQAMAHAWYEIMDIMTQRGPAADAELTKMAAMCNNDLTEFKNQLRTTAMYYTPESAITFTEGPEILAKMELVRNFCFAHGMLGEGASSANVIGIEYPGGKIQGDPKNIKLRFTTKFMREVADERAASK